MTIEPSLFHPNIPWNNRSPCQREAFRGNQTLANLRDFAKTRSHWDGKLANRQSETPLLKNS